MSQDMIIILDSQNGIITVYQLLGGGISLNYVTNSMVEYNFVKTPIYRQIDPRSSP